MAEILDGKKIAEELILDLQNKRKEIKGSIKLGIVLVGDNPASVSYVEQKQKIGKRLDVKVQLFKYDSSISTKKIKKRGGYTMQKERYEGCDSAITFAKNNQYKICH